MDGRFVERKEKEEEERSASFRDHGLRGCRIPGPGFRPRFCADILSYEIADIHRISIEMAADVAARQPLETGQLDPRPSCVRCSLSARLGSARSILQFYTNFPHLPRLHYYKGRGLSLRRIRTRPFLLFLFSFFFLSSSRSFSSPFSPFIRMCIRSCLLDLGFFVSDDFSKGEVIGKKKCQESWNEIFASGLVSSRVVQFFI